MPAFIGFILFSLTILSTGCDNDLVSTDRYAIKADTVLDHATGLLWERAGNLQYTSHESAIMYCNNLSLAGFDDWRLPTIDELRTIIAGCPATMPGGSCTASDPGCLGESCRPSACWSCENGKGPGYSGGYYCDSDVWAAGMGCGGYVWTSSVYADDNTRAWTVQFYNASVGPLMKDFVDGNARCVRTVK